MRTWVRLAGVAVTAVLAGAVLHDGASSGGAGAVPVVPAVAAPRASPPAVVSPSPVVVAEAPVDAADAPEDTREAPADADEKPADAARAAGGRPSATSALLVPAGGGDGDSWRDTTGREYRLGLVNTPEQGECFGAEATAERRARTADGFRASVYATDRYGRAVSVVTTADGTDLNVHLARNGFADDRFLAQFRGENEELARELDAAFAAARREGRGLWSACAAPDAPVPAPPPAGAECHRDYVTCVPVRGDGSGRGGGNDLDCGDVTGAVHLRQPGVDPYRFDADGDGVGCDS